MCPQTGCKNIGIIKFDFAWHSVKDLNLQQDFKTKRSRSTCTPDFKDLFQNL